MTGLTAERLRSVLDYSPDTGAFVWRGNVGSMMAGEEAGYLYKTGYRNIKVDGGMYLAHRLAWLYMTGSWPPHQIDHINRNRSDNRFTNLRSATNSQNMANTAKAPNKSSELKGVHWEQARKKWFARIIVSGRLHFLGRYSTAEAAHKAYQIAAHNYFGEFARTE